LAGYDTQAGDRLRSAMTAACPAPEFPGELRAHIVTGNVQLVTRELSQISPDPSLLDACASLAAANGQLNVLMYFRGFGARLDANDNEPIKLACSGGWVSVIEYLLQEGVDLAAAGGGLAVLAALNGHTPVLKFLHAHGYEMASCGKLLPILLANRGRRAVVEFLTDIDVMPAGRRVLAFLDAIDSSDLARVKIARGGVEVGDIAPVVLDRAARIGSVALVRYLDEGGFSISKHGAHPLLAAAKCGNFTVMKHVITHGFAEPTAIDAALGLALEGGHTEVIDYVNKAGFAIDRIDVESFRLAALNGHDRAFDLLMDAGLDSIAADRPAINAMAAELQSGDPVYRPSKLWEFFNEINLEQLRRFGMHRFKRCVNQNYFNYVPLGFNDQQLIGLLRNWIRQPSLAPLRAGLSDPDRYNRESRLVLLDRRIFKMWSDKPVLAATGRWLQRLLYRLLVGLLWDYVCRNDSLGLADKTAEPMLGAPIETWVGERLVSQDLAHSILEGFPEQPRERPIRIAEIGPGYGRVGDVLIGARNCRYFVFDIPPSLYVAQWYLSRRHPLKRIFAFRHIDRFEDVRDELEFADIAFFSSNQLALFPEGYFDIGVNISSLHEMRPQQIRHILGDLYRITAQRVYLKQYRHYRNPWDDIEVHEGDYPVADGWRKRSWRPDRIDARFFEAVLEREAPSARIQPSQPNVPPAAARRPSISILLANYDHAHYLKTSLPAILSQTDPADEIIVVDDGSTDGSAELIEQMLAAHSRARLLRQALNRGQHAAIQRALMAATSDYVVWASSDDLLAPHFIERTREALAANPGVGLCFSRLCAWREGEFTVTEFRKDNHGAAFDIGEAPRYFSPEALRVRLRRHYLWISGNTVAARRDLLLGAGGFDAALRWHADWFAFYAIALRHGAVGIPETLAMMRQRAETYSSAGMQDQPQQYRLLRTLLDTLAEPVNRDLLEIVRACPSLLSPFGRAIVMANLFRVRHWNVLLSVLGWHLRRGLGME